MRRSLLLIAGLSALAFAGADVFVAPARAEQETAGWGNPQAKLRIVEMVDYQCPYCQIVHQRLMEAMKLDKNAQVHIVPMPWISDESAEVARLVLSAGLQGKAVELHHALLGKDKPQSLSQAKDIARGLGIDMVKAERDMASKPIKDQAIANLRSAIGLNIKTTPALMIGKTLYTPSANEMPTVNQLRMMIDDEISKQGDN